MGVVVQPLQVVNYEMHFIPKILLLVLSIHFATALKCYLCVTCPNDKNGVEQECPKGAPVCSKIKAESPAMTMITKGCTKELGEIGCQTQTVGEVTTTGCSCDSDLCNAVPDTTTASKVSILLVAFL